MTQRHDPPPWTNAARWLRRNGRQLGVILVALLGLVLVTWLALLAYQFPWTGLPENELPSELPGTVVYYRELPRAKTLWDWMDLLLVPSLLAGGGYWFSRSQQQHQVRMAERQAQIDREIAADRAEETIMQAYFDRMTELLLANKLNTADEDRRARELARVRTLTIFLRLNGQRKGLVLRFLHELDLIAHENPVIELDGANLAQANVGEANLPKASFREVRLRHVLLQNANLRGADLGDGDLEAAILIGADLSGANLQGARLRKANLERARLTGADLRGADLTEANLKEADLTKANLVEAILEQAKWDGCLYDAKTLWPENFDPPPEAVRQVE
jgi:uncharacterized protein YjbI with pentapeptide repeats